MPQEPTQDCAHWDVGWAYRDNSGGKRRNVWRCVRCHTEFGPILAALRPTEPTPEQGRNLVFADGNLTPVSAVAPTQQLHVRSIHAEKAHCPKHGAVSAGFRVYATYFPDYSTPELCPLCYVDWVAANVMHTTTTAETRDD